MLLELLVYISLVIMSELDFATRIETLSVTMPKAKVKIPL